MIYFKNKIKLICLGVLLALFFLELGLNIASSLYAYFYSPDYVEDKYSGDTYRILCVGDSFTYGLGAGIENSFPRQLESILTKKVKHKKIKVFNFGVPGANSTSILRKFQNDILQTKPDCIIVTAGLNDAVHLGGVDLHKDWKAAFYGAMFNLKSIKLFNALGYNLKQKAVYHNTLSALRNKKSPDINIYNIEELVLKANISRNKGNFKEAISFYKKALMINPHNKITLLELGRYYVLVEELDAALSLFVSALNADDNDEKVYAEIQNILDKKQGPGEAVGFYTWLLTKHPKNGIIESKLAKSIILLGDNAFINKDYDGVMKWYGKAFALHPEDEIIFSRLAYTETVWYPEAKISEQKLKTQGSEAQDKISKIVQNNLKVMNNICKKKKIKLVFSGYPRGTPDAVKDVAKTSEILLIEHDAKFEKQIAQEGADKFLIFDGHCTKDGYKIIAEDIAAAILQFI